MSTPEVLSIIATLLAGQPDTASFEKLTSGGHDSRYPVAIAACPQPIPPFDIERQTMICGTVDVPENHAKPDGNRIKLQVAVMKAKSLSPAADPVIYLHGGPGGQAVPDSTFYDGLFANFRATRDVILFDQRASGISAQTVTCFETLADNFFELAGAIKDDNAPDPTKTCLDEIAKKGVVLADYNTTQNAYDVRAIMSALGYPTYNIYGVSYGTLLGQEVLRSAPEGVRAAILDSITFPDVPAYDTNGLPLDKAIGALAEQCAADADCNKTFPDLDKTIIAAADALAKSPIPATATRPEITLDTMVEVLDDRNLNKIPHIDNYMPLIVTEWAKGDSTTYDRLVGGALTPPETPDALARAFVGKADPTTLSLGYAAALEAVQRDGSQKTLEFLLSSLSGAGSNAAVHATAETLLDETIDSMLTDLDRDTLIAFGREYARFVGTKPGRLEIAAWLGKHFSGPNLDKLLAIVNLMTDADIAAFNARAERDVGKYYKGFASEYDLSIYACQEAIPFNSPEGYDKVAASYRFPFIAKSQEGVKELYEACKAFTPSPRAGFHEPVKSAIPVLATSGLNDTQTDNDAATRLATTLDNAQALIFPEAGHGVIIYSQCAKDIMAAFINNPNARVDAACVEDLKPEFVLKD